MFGNKKAPESKPDLSHILVSTSGSHQPYRAIDSIFALSSYEKGRGNIDLEALFEHVKDKLRTKCQTLGGDAVIDCHFSERSAHSGGLMPGQVVELWAYGTVVKYDAASGIIS